MVPVCEPLLTDRDAELVLECLRSGWVSSAGKYLDEFEARWSAYCGMTHGIAVSNGTAALQIAVELLDLKPGDEVILPTFSIISPALAIVRCGAIPVLVDSNADDWQMNVQEVEAKITSRTRAILVVHTYGHPVDMDPILRLARQHNLIVIEDAAEVHGAEYRGRRCGGLGDISVFSFYANKLITTGEGGMVLVRDAERAEKARALRNLCFQRKRRFYHDSLGYNFRMTNLQAALGVSQIERIDSIIFRKREIADVYRRELRDVDQFILPIEQPWARHVYWVFGVLIEPRGSIDCRHVASRLSELGVETRPFFLGMHEQPVFRRMGLFVNQRFPVAERLADQGLYLPNGLSLKEEQIVDICHKLRAIAKQE